MLTKNKEVIEGWSGPGKKDENIEPLLLSEDVLHIDMNKHGNYEWWYFDAHLDNGYTVVVFFYAKNPNPGPGTQGKTGIEIVLLRPDGVRNQKFIRFKKSEFTASRTKPEVKIGTNTLKVNQQSNGLPIYEIDAKGEGLGCHLTYKATVNGWKPGSGDSKFGDLGTFSWIIPFARATVEGSIIDNEKTLEVTGIGYHDHNWLDFPFPQVINYWMWGRIYSENHTISYAFIQCNNKVDNHQVKVLMVADHQEITTSTGEFDFKQNNFNYNSIAKHRFPNEITIKVENKISVILKVKRILEAQDMLQNFNPIFRFLAKAILKIKPGYFRLNSEFDLEIQKNGIIEKETGSTLHEIVIFKPIDEGSV